MFDRIESPVPPRVWKVFVACLLSAVLGPVVLAIAFVSFAVIGIAARLVSNPGIAAQGRAVGIPVREALLSPAAGIGFLGITSLVPAAVAVAAVAMSRESVARRLRVGRSALKPIAWIPAALGGVAIAFLLAMASSFIELPVRHPAPSIAVEVWTLLVASFIGAPAQELLFRGYAQPPLCERWGAMKGILVAALLSSLFGYGSPFLPWQFYPSLFVSGTYLGWLAQRSGSVRVPAAVRALATAVVMGVPLLGLRLPTSWGAYAAILLGVVGVMVSAMAWFARCSGSPSVASDPGTLAPET